MSLVGHSFSTIQSNTNTEYAYLSVNENGEQVLMFPQILSTQAVGPVLHQLPDGTQVLVKDDSLTELSQVGGALLQEVTQLNSATYIETLGKELEQSLTKAPPKPAKPPEINPPLGEGPYPCDICAKEFSKWRQLQRHMKSHAEDKPHRCLECHETFNVKENLTLHLALHNLDHLQCPECMRTFTRLASLKAHIMVHEREESIVCEQCGDEFTVQSQLENHTEAVHQITQTGSTVYRCKHCPMSFHTLSTYKEHQLQHKKIKISLQHRTYKRNVDRTGFPHKCNYCLKAFQKPSQLQRHARIHTGERPFKCEICNKSFSQKGSLEIHKSKHTGEKPFTCEFCSAPFSQKGNLRAHIQRVHTNNDGEAQFQCNECPCVFKKLGSLNAHISKMHAQYVNNDEDITRKVKQENCADDDQITYSVSQNTSIRLNAPHALLDSSQTSVTANANKEELRYITIDATSPDHIIVSTVDSLDEASLSQLGSSDCVLTSNAHVATDDREHCSTETVTDGSDAITAAASANAIKKSNEHSHDMSANFTTHINDNDNTNDGNVVKHSAGGRAAASSEDIQSLVKDATAKDVVDVIQQIISLSDPQQAQQHIQQIVGNENITSDILQQALLNSGLSSSSLPGDGGGSTVLYHTTNEPVTAAAASLPTTSSEHDANGESDAPLAPAAGESLLKGYNSKSNKHPASPVVSTRGTMMVHDGISARPNKHVIRKVNGIRWHQCTYCSKEFKKPSDLVRHIRIHTHEKPYKCPQCFRAFAVKSTLTAHIKAHSGVKQYLCGTCHKTFATPGSLKVHQRLHTGARPFKCMECDRVFRTSGHLKTHLANHLSTGTTKPTSLSTNHLFTSNVRLSDVQLPDPIVIRDGDLMQPAQKHIGIYQPLDGRTVDRQYKCIYCSRAFKKSSHLKQHIRSHTGERPYKCMECQRSFVSGGVLKAHLRTHSGIRSYKCAVCSAMLTTSGSLKRHMSTHSDMRPYMCPLCHKTFKTNVNCRKHMKTHRADYAICQADGTAGEVTAVVIDSGDQATLDYTQALSQVQVSGQQDMTLGIVDQAELDEMSEAAATVLAQQTLSDSAMTHGVVSDNTMTQGIESDSAMTHGTMSDGAVTHGVVSDDAVTVADSVLHGSSVVTSVVAGSVGGDDDGGGGVSNMIDPTTQHKVVIDDVATFTQQQKSQQVVLDFNQAVLESSATAAASLGAITLPPQSQFTLQPTQDNVLDVASLINFGNTATSLSQVISQNNIQMHSILSTSRYKDGDLLTMQAESNNEPDEGSGEGGTGGTSDGGGGVSEETMLSSVITSMASIPSSTDTAGLSASITANIRPSLASATDTNLGVPSSADVRLAANAPSDEDGVKNIAGVPVVSAARSLLLDKHQKNLPMSPPPADPTSDSQAQITVMSGVDNKVDEQEQYRCDLCDQQFNRASQLKAHIRKHTGDRPYTCHLCFKTFPTQSAVRVHERIHTGTHDFKCDICDATFSAVGSLKRHLLVHSSETPYKCGQCEESFKTLGRLKRHELKNCTGSFLTGETEANKSTHTVIRVTQDSITQIALDQKVLSISERVLQESTQERNRICEVKGYETLPQSMNLTRHPNQCDQCEKSFKKPSDLVRHKRIHTGERPYRCHICTRSFTVKSTLDTHMRTHRGVEKNFMCHICKACFSTKGSLKVHMRLHTGARPFKCPHCECRFRTSGHRKSHITIHTRPSKLPKIIVCEQLDDGTTTAASDIQDRPVQPEVLSLADSAIQAPVEAVMLQIAGTSQGYHLTGVTSGGALQPIQLDTNIIQQLQAQGLNITAAPSVITTSTQDDDINISTAPAIVNSDSSVATADMRGLVGGLGVNDVDVGVMSMGVGVSGAVSGVSMVDARVVDSQCVVDSVLSAPPSPIVETIEMIPTDSLPIQSQHVLIQDMAPADDDHNDNDSEDLRSLSGGEISGGDSRGVTSRQSLFVDSFASTAATTDTSNTYIKMLEKTSHMDKSIQCKCGRWFKSGDDLTEHMKTHFIGGQTGRPHVCPTCEKSFIKPSQLKRHILIHTGERPFKCTECDKAFNQKNALDIHMKKHSGLREHGCPYCEMAFVQKGNLNTHIKTQHHHDMRASMKISHQQPAALVHTALDSDTIVIAGCDVIDTESATLSGGGEHDRAASNHDVAATGTIDQHVGDNTIMLSVSDSHHHSAADAADDPNAGDMDFAQLF